MLEAAQGALLSLVCIENSRHNKVCYFLPVAWPELCEDIFVDCYSIVESGMIAFWFNSCDVLQTAEQKSGQEMRFGFSAFPGENALGYFNGN